VSLTWSLAVNHPTATVRVVPTSGGHHVVVHHSFDGLELDDVREVLCRPRQHARMVRGPELLGELQGMSRVTQCDDSTRFPSGALAERSITPLER